jgi:hypothetical protein
MAWRAFVAARGAAARAGLQITPATYDSPIPRVEALGDAFFARPSSMAGVDWDPAGQLAWVERELGDELGRWRPPVTEPDPEDGFVLRNGAYESVDAELLHAVVRRFGPTRVVELGSGWSSLVLRRAARANRAQGRPCALSAWDPHPSPLLARPLPGGPEIHRVRAQEVPVAVIDALGRDDILFVDTSHTVKAGGDVNHIVLELLPRLRPGVLVHFHDVFLPWPYSRAHLEGGRYWAEQDLLQAFLSGNRAWEVLVGAQAVARHAPARLAALVPSFGPHVSPGALWLRRTDR